MMEIKLKLLIVAAVLCLSLSYFHYSCFKYGVKGKFWRERKRAKS
jgi:hypothetical protein